MAGQTVLALQNGKWVSKKVAYSGAGGPAPQTAYPYAVFVKLSNGSSIIATADHPFILANKSVKRADRLVPTDQLMSDSLKPLKIVSLKAGSYKGYLVNIMTNAPKKKSIEGHVISTNGVLSGDFYVQNYLTPQDKKRKLLQVGTNAYNKKYAAFFNQGAPPFNIMRMKIANTLKTTKIGTYSLKKSTINKMLKAMKKRKAPIKFSDGTVFTPYRKMQIPNGAHPFLPPGQDIPKRSFLKSLNSSVPYEIARYLVHHFERFYPKIKFVIDWPNDVANAYAWIQNGQRYVSITGGLLRHKHIGIEGASLVLAHEVGHHYGGLPRYTQQGSTWASCEGQSDYWGALIGMRQVWWGPEALKKTKTGAKQLYNFFAFGLVAGNLIKKPVKKPSSSLCSHPPAQCRLDTYLAAVRMDKKPSCAGPTVDLKPASK